MLLYQKIRNHIQELLASGALKSGSKLPSERRLQQTFQSTRTTVREALTRLEAEGLIYSQNRRGWFVTPQKLKWYPAKKVNFNNIAIQQGFKPETHVISLTPPVNDNEISRSHFSGKPIYELQRVRALNHRPIMIEQIYCESERFPNLESQPLNSSITSVMSQNYHVEVSSEQCAIHVTVLPDDMAGLLEKNSGAPCLKVYRARYDTNQKLVDYNIEHWLHDAIEMLVEGL